MDEKTKPQEVVKTDSLLTPEVHPEAQVPAEKPLVKEVMPKKNIKKTLSLILGSLVVVLAGVATGWFLSGTQAKSSISKSGGDVVVDDKKQVTEAGVTDESTFRDSAEGVLKSGGIKGEGTHYLDRDMGEEKYVYLTSTVIDLDAFIDKKVTVWGETISAKSAGWLMDVGKIKVVE